ncbi:MAG: hypothetical protein ACK5OI_00015 [Curvibacter sp.]|jgi:hypothetical protein
MPSYRCRAGRREPARYSHGHGTLSQPANAARPTVTKAGREPRHWQRQRKDDNAGEAKQQTACFGLSGRAGTRESWR